MKQELPRQVVGLLYDLLTPQAKQEIKRKAAKFNAMRKRHHAFFGLEVVAHMPKEQRHAHVH